MTSWKKLAEEYVYQGWRKIIRKRFELPSGKLADFDILGAGHYVTVAALTDDDHFVMVRQFRPGPERFLLSFPEGAIDPGESAEAAARRELLEETGYEAGEIVFLRHFYSSYTIQVQTCLLATGCRYLGESQHDDDEFIDVITIPRSQLRSLLRTSDDQHFTNVGCAYLALEYLGNL